MYQCSKKLVTCSTVVLTILTFQDIQCLHVMYAEVAWVLVSSRTQVQPQVILDPDYLPDYLPVSYDYDNIKYCYQLVSTLVALGTLSLDNATLFLNSGFEKIWYTFQVQKKFSFEKQLFVLQKKELQLDKMNRFMLY